VYVNPIKDSSVVYLQDLFWKDFKIIFHGLFVRRIDIDKSILLLINIKLFILYD
jgi:hypothetical protein